MSRPRNPLTSARPRRCGGAGRARKRPLSRPSKVIWEITQRCNLRCRHCLIDGGRAGDDELTLEEALAAVDQIAELGASIVTLTGGEPLLRDDWPDIARGVVDRGMKLRFSANGHGLDDATLELLVELGTDAFAVSLDGVKSTHDKVRVRVSRAAPSAFDEALAALDRLRPSPIATEVITTVTKENLDELEQIRALLIDHGVRQWVVQLAHRTGRLRDRRSRGPSLVEPSDLPRLVRTLVRIGRRRSPRLLVHNTIGYMSAEEPLLFRQGPSRRLRFWAGCGCGRTTMGIAPNGDVKGCANQIGAPFVVGNLRVEPLADIWRDRSRWHWLDPSPEQMSGPCAGCALSEVCGAGCTALAYSASGELFNNPFCARAIAASVEEATP